MDNGYPCLNRHCNNQIHIPAERLLIFDPSLAVFHGFGDLELSRFPMTLR
ncbi:hypothetical protein T12_10021 [Trichinella patagoniensis]|uniref:Uncharacterized protein n=1 Tax=Trichinella patagoniensis TaxID=990121 RepID=A0A0V0ZGR4_9BILA|nr:hypothetical protein T12_10021 [Trichinella patagoniensis]